MRVYLAGGMSDGWQAQMADPAITFLDPRTWQDDDPAVYTRRDLEAIRSADAVLAYMDSANPSGYGMSLEVGFAHALGIPVVFVDAMQSDWRGRYFGMVRSVSTVARSTGEAVLYLKDLKRAI